MKNIKLSQYSNILSDYFKNFENIFKISHNIQ